jgi:hypothetical protein
MTASQNNAATEVLALLKAAKLSRDHAALQQAVELARVPTPQILSQLTPRFDAYFAISTLVKSLKRREDTDSVNRRFEHALSLTKVWAEQLRNNDTP